MQTRQRRTRVKICGLTRVQDITAAAAAGVDALGFVFYPESSRALTLEQAVDLRQAVPAFVDLVALFVNASASQVQDVIDRVGPDYLQFHGDETPEFCASFGRRYLRAFRVGAPGLDTAHGLLKDCQRYGEASAWLFDSYSAAYGGSGKGFDTGLLSEVQAYSHSAPMILAGGLDAQTLAHRVTKLRPYAVDVSSGVETSPAIKCQEKIQAFMAAIQDADSISNTSIPGHATTQVCG